MPKYCELKGTICQNYKDHLNSNFRRNEVFIIYDSLINKAYWDKVKHILSEQGFKIFDPIKEKTLRYFLIDKICCAIRNSLFVVADISHWREGEQKVRPNVYFEIGLSMGFNKPCILLYYSSLENQSLIFSDFDGIEMSKFKFISIPPDLLENEKDEIIQKAIIAERDAVRSYLRELCEEELNITKSDIKDKIYFESSPDNKYFGLSSLLRFQSKIDLFNLETFSLFQNIFERFFDNGIITDIISHNSVFFKNRENMKLVQECRSNFLDLVNHKKYFEVLAHSSMVAFCRGTQYLDYELNLENRSRIISNIIDLVKNKKNYQLYIYKDDDLPRRDTESKVIKNNYLLISASRTRPSESETPLTWGNFRFGDISTEENAYKDIVRSDRIVSNQEQVLQILKEYLHLLGQ